MSKFEVLPVDLLRLDGDTQARVAVNQEAVDEYSELIDQGKAWPFDQITVFYDGTDYWIADGFHRTLAAIKAGRASVPCKVMTGTARDARIFGMRANDLHGLRMSREDRRKNVIWLLTAYPTMTQKEVAEKAGVHFRTVENIVAEQKKSDPQIVGDPPKTRGKVKKTESKEPTSAEKKEAERAKKAAEKEAEKVRKAAEKEAEKTRKAAEREAAKKAKEAERAAAKEAAAKAKEEAKKAERAAKAKAREEAREAERKQLPAKEQEKMIREVFNQHHGRIIKAMADFFELNPNRTALNANMKLLNQVKLW